MSKTEQEFYDLKEATEFTRLSSSLLRAAAKSGELQSTRSNENTGKLIFHKSWLRAFMLRGVYHAG